MKRFALRAVGHRAVQRHRAGGVPRTATQSRLRRRSISPAASEIKAADLYANLNDGDASNDPFMVDIRAPEDYAIGHMPGAINIPVKVLFTADGLAKLPKEKQIVLNCYSGQTASHPPRPCR